MFKVLEVSLEEDLSQFGRLLWQKKISHRIHRIQNRQILTVAKDEQANQAVAYYEQWKQGIIQPDKTDSVDFTSYFSSREFLVKFVRAFARAPLSLVVIITCTVLAFAAPLASMNELARAMLFPDFSFGTRLINLETVVNNFTFLHLMKMITPILLHGGLVHLVFNMLWTWEFGRRIEAVQPSWALLMLIIVIALFSNTIQFLYGGSIFFGGMSGVVYGLFGYICLWQFIDPGKNLALPGALIFFLLLTLFIMTAIDLDFVADEAHIGGLIAGVICGAIAAGISRIKRQKIKN
jgi:GlpG protein